MTLRSTTAAFAVAALVAITGLLIGAASDHRDTAFSLDVAGNHQVATLRDGERLCEGPLLARAPFSAFQIWARPARALDVAIRTGSGGSTNIARPIKTASTPTGLVTIPAGSSGLRRGARFEVCIRNADDRMISLEGGAPSRWSGKLTIGGDPRPNAVAMLFLRSGGPSLLDLLPTVFARASLFKLSWTGPWTYWLLCAALLAAIGLVGLALRTAIAEDLDRVPSREDAGTQNH